MNKMKKKNKYENTERRKYPKVEYLNIKGARLKIGRHKFGVSDISQRGLKFLNDKEVNLSEYISGESEYISGELTFLFGDSIAIEGSLIWEQDDDFGLYLKNLIPSDIIQKEALYIQEQLSSK